MKYEVQYLARKGRAIGIFYRVDVTVHADSVVEAASKAFDELHRRGMETLHPKAVLRIDGDNPVDVTHELFVTSS